MFVWAINILSQSNILKLEFKTISERIFFFCYRKKMWKKDRNKKIWIFFLQKKEECVNIYHMLPNDDGFCWKQIVFFLRPTEKMFFWKNHKCSFYFIYSMSLNFIFFTKNKNSVIFPILSKKKWIKKFTLHSLYIYQCSIYRFNSISLFLARLLIDST